MPLALAHECAAPCIWRLGFALAQWAVCKPWQRVLIRLRPCILLGWDGLLGLWGYGNRHVARHHKAPALIGLGVPAHTLSSLHKLRSLARSGRQRRGFLSCCASQSVLHTVSS